MKLLANWLVTERDNVLTGARVVLRPPAMDHFDAWAALRIRSRAFLEPWEPRWDERELTRASYRDRVRRCLQLAEEDSAYAYMILKSNDELVGAITLSNIRRGVAQMGSLGYWIGEPYKQKGYMTDAVSTISRFAFTELGLNRVEAACLPRNAASIRLLQNCRFTQEGLARQYLRIAGRWEDHLLYAKLVGDH
jgi:ribosomal-protein-alanine N-acetyltransferase